MLDRVYPFICKQNQTLFYSWGLNLPLSSEHRFTYKELCALGKSLYLSPNTLVARFSEESESDYLTFKRQGGCYIVKRSSIPHSYIGLPFNPNWRSELTSLEVILLTAKASRDLNNQSPLTYGEIAARTGYSRRQVIRHVGILADKGYLVPCIIEEEIRVTTRRGFSSKEREKQSHKLSSSFKKEYISYLKNITPEDIKFKPSNIKNITDFWGSDCAKKDLGKPLTGKGGSPSKTSTEGRRKQGTAPQEAMQQGNTPLKAAWAAYEIAFAPGERESLKGVEALIRKGKLKPQSTQKIIKAILKAKTIPFLKVASGFGWKEAVIECYQRKALYIGASSRHIEKFSSSKLSFAWIMGHADEIVAGKYDEIAINPKQRAFEDSAKQWRAKDNCRKGFYKKGIYYNAHKAPEARATKGAPVKEDLAQEVKTLFGEEEQRARLYLLEKVSPSFYVSWLKDLPITVEGEKVLIRTNNPFKAQYLEKKFYTDNRISVRKEQKTNSLEHSLKPEHATGYSSTNSSQAVLHETQLTGQSLENSMAHSIPPSHEAIDARKRAVPSFLKGEGRGEESLKTETRKHTSHTL